jgi:Phage lysozyme
MVVLLGTIFALFPARQLQHGPATVQGERRHQAGHRKIRPGRSSAEHAQGGDEHGKVADGVVARAYLTADMADALRATLRYCPVLANEPEGRLAAIVDFTFNLGAGRLQASTLRRRVNQRDWSGAAQELRRWVYGGGRVLPGLVIRREAETLLLF